MAKPTTINKLFVNLPIKDVARARAFWSELGFTFNEDFSNDQALCLVLKPDAIYAMLLTHEFFQTFTNRPIADGHSTQVLLSIDAESREQVDELMRIALANGATHYLPSEDHGWMYLDRFADPDGHQWEIGYMDESLRPSEL